MKIDERLLDGPIAFDTAIAALRAGKPVSLEVQRDSQTVHLRVTPAPIPKEELPGVDVLYDSLLTERGHRLRAIITKPQNATGKLPALLLAGWLSCDSVEGPADTADGFLLLLHGIATRSGFVLMRVDKQGVGDSEGPPCAETDFETELAGYRAALRTLKRLDYVDPEHLFIVGMSNGGGFAPLVAAGERVSGYIVSGGWVKTWFEHMMEIERRRLSLSGKTPGEVSASMRSEAQLYDLYLNQRMTPGEVIRRHPQLRNVWGDLPQHQYGRPASFYHQLQQLNLAAAWGKVDLPVLAIHGEYDWIMSREDHELIVRMVNRNRAGCSAVRRDPTHGSLLSAPRHPGRKLS